MNIDKSANDLLFLNFNQDFSCVSVGTKHGYRIYNCDPFGKCYSKGKTRHDKLLARWNSSFLIAADGTGIVEMLFCTSLVALVGSGEQPSFSTRHLQIINTKVLQE